MEATGASTRVKVPTHYKQTEFAEQCASGVVLQVSDARLHSCNLRVVEAVPRKVVVTMVQVSVANESVPTSCGPGRSNLRGRL